MCNVEQSGGVDSETEQGACLITTPAINWVGKESRNVPMSWATVGGIATALQKQSPQWEETEVLFQF
jgi:hypothetical protein